MPSASSEAHRPARGAYPAVLAVCALLAACGGGRAASAPQPAEQTARATVGMDSIAAGPAVPCVWVDSARQTDSAATAGADVAIIAHVHAQSVRVDEARGTRVGAAGPAGAPVRCEVRTNLPHPVQHGRTYHDVQIDLRITSRLDTTRAAAPDTARPPKDHQPEPGATP